MNQIIGGGFTYPNGAPLFNGYILFQLTNDCSINSVNGYGQVGRSVVKANLNCSGNIKGTVNIWPNDVLLPSGSQYIIRVYSQAGMLVSGPSLLTITSSPSPFVLNA